MRTHAAQRDITEWKKAETERIKGSKLSAKEQKKQLDELDKEEEKKLAEAKKRKKAWDIANLWIGTLAKIPQVIAGYTAAFAPLGVAAPPLISSYSGASIGMMMGSAALQTAAIAAYANGGIVGATTGPDNTMAHVRTGEMILNANQQRELFDIANGETPNYNAGISVNIESFSGSDDDLTRLEDMLYGLQSNGRISNAVFA